jgi:hypothetical protein
MGLRDKDRTIEYKEIEHRTFSLYTGYVHYDPQVSKRLFKNFVSAPNRWDEPLIKIGSCEYPQCLYTAERRSLGDQHEPTDTDDSEN